ncbi:MAG: hypothetical protein N2558_04660 [Patescibacteria group bacterium]|nr:hypothetical protein [Patescibacteria group bacterium]
MDKMNAEKVIDCYLANLFDEKVSTFLDINSESIIAKRIKKFDRSYLRLKKKTLKDCDPLFRIDELLKIYFDNDEPKLLCELTEFIDDVKQRIFAEIGFHEHLAFSNAEQHGFFRNHIKIKKEDRNCFIGDLIKKYQIPKEVISFSFFAGCLELEAEK